MREETPGRDEQGPATDGGRALDSCASLVDRLYAQSKADQWGVPREQFSAALERSAKKRLASGAWTAQNLEEYLRGLHIEDMALAAACAEGCETAWEHFFTTYRPYLRAAAAAILHCAAGSAEACELADSLFTELYGLADGKGTERSLFRYFHGRSSLKTWLRAILAQRHIDSIRAGRRFEELAEGETGDGGPRTQHRPPVQPVDPHRERYVASFTRALQTALDALDPQEKE